MNAKFADRRAEEIDYLTSKGETGKVQAVTERLNAHLEKITDLTARENRPEASQKINTDRSGRQSPPVIAGLNNQKPLLGVTSAPSTSAILPENSSRQSQHSQPQKSPGVSNSKQKLEQLLTDHFKSRQVKLEEALKRASSEAKPAILRALTQSQEAYEKALNNLESDDTGN